MPLRNNLPYLGSGFKREDQKCLCCPRCGFKTCWCHGWYPRKGFHRTQEEAANLVIWVLRGLCCNPSCGHSFNILPADVLPYQRFFWPDFLRIAELAEAGKNAYKIAAELAVDSKGHRAMEISLAVLVRTLRHIRELCAWLDRVTLELDIMIAHCLKDAALHVCERLGWAVFTHRWFHALYPTRIHRDTPPHNSALSP